VVGHHGQLLGLGLQFEDQVLGGRLVVGVDDDDEDEEKEGAEDRAAPHRGRLQVEHRVRRQRQPPADEPVSGKQVEPEEAGGNHDDRSSLQEHRRDEHRKGSPQRAVAVNARAEQRRYRNADRDDEHDTELGAHGKAVAEPANQQHCQQAGDVDAVGHAPAEAECARDGNGHADAGNDGGADHEMVCGALRFAFQHVADGPVTRR
jgi:hypothetical protein